MTREEQEQDIKDLEQAIKEEKNQLEILKLYIEKDERNLAFYKNKLANLKNEI